MYNRVMRTLTTMALVVLIAAVARGQSARYDSVALGARGPIAGATIAVCTQPASTGTTPCSPLATLATSASTTSGGANPLTADALGNFHFYAAPGTYTIQIYGPQVASPYVMTDVGVGPGNTGAVKPAASDAVQFIGLNGIDTNSGFSMGDPLGNADVAAAFATSLANISANSDHGGQIYVLPGVYPFTGNVQLPITGHTAGTAKYKTAIHIHCIGQVVFQFTSGFSGDAFNQVITDTGQQNDQGATIDGNCIFDAGQTSGAAARTAWRFGGTEHTYVGPNVEFRNFVNPNNSVTNVSANGTTATITASNNYVANELVVVSTVGHELLNGVWPVQSATSSSFTIPTNQTISSVADTGVTAEWSSPVVIQNATGMNTNDWMIDGPKFLTSQVDITSMGPATNCLGGSPNSSQDQHFSIRGWFGMSVGGSRGNIGIAAICGIAMSRGTIDMSSSLNDPNDHVMSVDLQSYIAQVAMTDNMENNTGGTATRYLAPATSNTPETAGTISLTGDFLNMVPFANENTTSGQLLCGEDLTNNVFKCPTIVLPSSGGGTILHQAPSMAGTFTITDPAATGNAVVDSATQTLTNKTFDLTSNTSLKVQQVSSPINFGTPLSSQTLLTGLPSAQVVMVQVVAIQTTTGVGCGAGTNTVTVTVTGAGLGSPSGSGTSISANGSAVTGILLNNIGVAGILPASTALTYSTTSTLASTGCSTVPQYTVYAKVVY